MIRAWNKEKGPDRITQSSYGFAVTLEHNPKAYPAHKNVKRFHDRIDDRYYVRNTIEWLVRKVNQSTAAYTVEFATADWIVG